MYLSHTLLFILFLSTLIYTAISIFIIYYVRISLQWAYQVCGSGFGSYELVLADEIVNLLFEDLEGYPVLDI